MNKVKKPCCGGAPEETSLQKAAIPIKELGAEEIKKEAEKPKKDEKIRKRSLISAIIGVSIAIFTFICCGLLIPLGLIGAAVFLH